MRRIKLILFAAALVPTLVPAANLLTSQTKLGASDAAAGNEFAWSVAASGDTVALGARGNDAIYVFGRSGGLWSQQQKLTEAGVDLGWSVGMSDDTVIGGAPGSQSAYVFVRSGGTWNEQQKLTASDGMPFDAFGLSVAISGDTAVVGSPGDDDAGLDSGSAYVFVRSGGIWSQQQKLMASDSAAGNSFGSVAISGDTAVVGAYRNNAAGPESGAAYVFVRTGGTWTQQQKLIASDATAGDWFGFSVGISGDTVVVGTPSDACTGSSCGSAYVFVRSGGLWAQQQKLSSATPGDNFGVSVAISGDRIVAGAFGADAPSVNSGAAFLFVRSGGIWSQQQKLAASDAGANDQIGWQVGISGETVVVNAYQDDDAGADSGAAYIFEPDTRPPTITNLVASPDTLWPPNYKMAPVTITVAATDDSAPAPACRIISVSSNESAGGSGHGHTSDDWEITGPLTVNLRAERSGRGNGRRYTITVECTDSSGNIATASTTVVVPNSQRH